MSRVSSAASSFAALRAVAATRLPAAIDAIRSARTARRAPPETVEGLDVDLRGPIGRGRRLVLYGFGGFLAIAGFAPLDRAVVAPGFLAVESQRRVVQHLEGGIVAQVLVANGSRVGLGDTLIRLDGRQAQARRAQLAVRLLGLGAERARIEAELAGTAELVAGPALAGLDADAVAGALALQSEILATRRTEHRHRRAALEARTAQADAELAALEAQRVGRDARLVLLRERAEAVAGLAEGGHASRVQSADAQSALADGIAAREEVAARIAGAEERRAQIREELATSDGAVRTALVERLQTLDRDIAETHEGLVAAEDVLRRTDILAPAAGTVQGLAVHGPGGVVGPGERLMEIVPGEDALVVEAEIRPEDIESVVAGQSVDVRLAAFGHRSTLPVSGTLVEVSADRLVDARTGRSHYRAVVALAETTGPEAAPLRPGMPAEVMILQGRRTLLGYLLAPLRDATARAFRD